jgi:hypothetical protein
MDKHTLKVSITFDRDKVNYALGNTPNVDARRALEELLKSAFYEYDADLEHMSFEIDDL